MLRPGGRFGISDVLAEPGLDPALRAAAEYATGCPVGMLTADEYRDLLLTAGFASTRTIRTHPLTGGRSSAIVQATPRGPRRHDPTRHPVPTAVSRLRQPRRSGQPGSADRTGQQQAVS